MSDEPERIKGEDGEPYKRRINEIIDSINLCHVELMADKRNIVLLKNLLRLLFRELYSKMTNRERDEQISFDRMINKIRLFRLRVFPNEQLEIVERKEIIHESFIKISRLLNRKELNLREIIERLNLTAPNKKRRVR